MKKPNILTGSLLAAIGVALFAPPVHAQSTITYNTGDLLLGFELPGNASDYVVDIGAASNYLGVVGSFDVNTSAVQPGGLGNIGADLTSIFGSSWATTEAEGSNVQWGIVGATNKLSSGPFGLPANTLFLTQAESPVGTQSSAPPTHSNSNQENTNAKIISYGTTFNGLTSTANSNYGAVETAANSDSWSSFDPSTNAFSLGYGIEQPSSGTYIGPTNSVLDLYELQPVNGGTGTYEGNFSLSSSGTLTFTGAATPEPGSWGLLVLGVGFLGMLRHRRSAVAA